MLSECPSRLACLARTRDALVRLLAAMTLCAMLCACAIVPPAPWEKDLLARPAMQMDMDPLEQRTSEHIYTSKENSSGGYAVGGGGCGCN